MCISIARARCAGALLVLVSAALPCVAVAGSLTLAEALALTDSRHPGLAAFDAQTEASRQRAAVAALSPPINLNVTVENFAGTGDASGIDALETTLQLSRVIELGNKAQLRRTAGTADLEVLERTQRATRLDLHAEVARRFVHVAADQETLKTAQRALVLAERSRTAVQERVNAGAASPVALSRAEIAVARAEIAREHAEHELASSRVTLCALWGDAEPGFTEVSAELFTLPSTESLATYQQRLESNPELLRLVSEARLNDARVQLAESQRRRDLQVSFGVRRLEALNEQAFVAGVSIPLGTAQRARGELLAARADRATFAYSVEAHRLELRALLFELYQELVHARTESEALRSAVRPQAESMLSLIDSGFRAGRFSLLELADAQRQLLEIEQDAIDAAAKFHMQLIELERLTAEPVRAR